MTKDGEFDVRPAVPVSFGKCTFTGIPCLALHDVQLIPSPAIAPQNVHWLRHQVTAWTPDAVGPLEGCFSVRSVHIDPDAAPISDAATWLNGHQSPGDSAVTVTDRRRSPEKAMRTPNSCSTIWWSRSTRRGYCRFRGT